MKAVITPPRPRTDKRRSPSVRLGIVGLGFGSHIAESLIGRTEATGFTVAAVCDSDYTRVAAYCRNHRVRGYVSLDQLLADETIPVIGLFTGPMGRASLIRQIIRAGKDVMTTKPFELDPRAAEAVLLEAAELGRTVMVNSPGPEPAGYVHQISRWREEFSLGPPVSCHAEMLVSYRERPDGSWLDDPSRCPAAPLLRLGVYSINDLVQLFGPVRAIQVASTRVFTQRPTPDNALLSLVFENQAIGSVTASFGTDNGRPYANSLILNYERGSIYRNISPANSNNAEGTTQLQLRAIGPSGPVYAEWQSLEGCGAYPWKALRDMHLGLRPPVIPLNEILNGVHVIAALGRAERSGRSETILPHPRHA